jgi:hypothetical protein
MLSTGTRLGAYEVAVPLGAGSMIVVLNWSNELKNRATRR